MRRFGTVLSVFMMFVLLIGLTAIQTVVTEAAGSGPKRWNIVFVTDESKSMDGSDGSSGSDPENLRYDAIKLFASEITDTGNYLGSVSFAKDVIDFQEMKETNGKAEKDAYVSRISNVQTSSWTNIGGALKRAVEILQNGNSSYESAIILLSDGNTEFPRKENKEKQLSLDQKAEAVEECRQKGIKIFTICLNVNDNADEKELRQLATATGGEFTEVDSAADIREVETLYYRMLFNGTNIDNDDGETVRIGSDGTVSKNFMIPKVGVEELNILVEGEVESVMYTDPAGQTISGNELEGRTTSGNGYIMTKLIHPDPGNWKVTAYGDPKAEITLRYMKNTNFYIETSIDPTGNFRLNEPVSFSAEVYDGNGRVTDQEALSEMEAEISLEGSQKDKQFKMILQGDCFVGSFTPDSQGTYYATVNVSNNDMSDTSNIYEISVDNDAPVPPQETPKAHANIWPVIGGKASIDLSGTAIDPNGEELKYSVENTAFNPDDYSLEGSILTVSHYSISKGSFTIRATDPQGAYCTYDVLFTSTNIGLIMAIVSVIGVLVATIVVVMGIRRLLATPFMGTISVSIYDQDLNSYENTPVSDTPGRGQRPLTAFGMGPLGFAKGTHFQAAGKLKKVIFKSNKPFYTETYPGSTKTVDIQSRMEVHIFPTSDMKKGITVRFKSILDIDDDGFMFN